MDKTESPDMTPYSYSHVIIDNTFTATWQLTKKPEAHRRKKNKNKNKTASSTDSISQTGELHIEK